MDTGKRILIVDDNSSFRDMLGLVLENDGYETMGLTEGVAGLSVIESFRPDLVLLDLSMPKIHGLEVLSLIRKKYTSVELPIIVISGDTQVDTVVRSLELGANDYISKPINFKITLMRIQTQLKFSSISRETSRLQKIETLNALVVTYNHEINNPLAIAVCSAELIERTEENKIHLSRLSSALQRIAKIIQQISQLTTRDQVELHTYRETTKMIKLSGS